MKGTGGWSIVRHIEGDPHYAYDASHTALQPNKPSNFESMYISILSFYHMDMYSAIPPEPSLHFHTS